jgi:hypothetical protein
VLSWKDWNENGGPGKRRNARSNTRSRSPQLVLVARLNEWENLVVQRMLGWKEIAMLYHLHQSPMLNPPGQAQIQTLHPPLLLRLYKLTDPSRNAV